MRIRFEAQKRPRLTRGNLRQLRMSGRLPGTLYGKDIMAIDIHLPLRDVQSWAKQGYSEVIDLNIADEGTYPAILKDIQRDPITGKWLHVDFHQVRMDQPIRVKVPLEMTGTPAGVKAGGALQIVATQLEVEGKPNDLPPSIEVNVSALEIGQSMTAGEVQLPPGLTLAQEPEEVIVTVLAPRLEQNETEEEAAETNEET